MSILLDFKTCPLPLTLSTPPGGKQTLSLKNLSVWNCCPCPPMSGGHRPAPKSRGENQFPSLCPFLKEGEEHPDLPPRDSPGHLYPLPLAFFIFTPFPSLHPALLLQFTHLQTSFNPPRKLLEEVKKGKKRLFGGAQQQGMADSGTSASPRPQPALQH